jgi:hypothetical protein
MLELAVKGTAEIIERQNAAIEHTS